MKKILLSALLLGSLFSVKAQDQVTNTGFNTWEDISYGNDPTMWYSAFDAFGGLETPLIQKSTDATDQTYSAKLLSQDYDGDVAFGFVLHGEIGGSGPEGGVPFTINADSIVFDAKHDIMAGDSANVYVILKNGGMPFDMNIIRIGGQASDWTRYSFPINSWSFVPDSLILGFTSSETENDGAQAGSWFQVDNVRFVEGSTESTTVPDFSFETWEDVNGNEPEGWFTYNSSGVTTGVSFVRSTTDLTEGTAAMELEGDSLILGNSMQFIPGFAANGGQDQGGNFVGTPFVAVPTSLTGQYKWAPVNGDEGNIQVSFKKEGAEFFGSAFTFAAEQTTYASFNIPLVLSMAPDTVLVMIYAGGEEGSVLKIDDLKFNGGDVSTQVIYATDATINVFPNPIIDKATLKIGLPKAEEVSYVVVNALGQKMTSHSLGHLAEGVHSINLNTTSFNTGVYFVKVQIGNKLVTQRVIIK